jgi:hypothetical protein
MSGTVAIKRAGAWCLANSGTVVNGGEKVWVLDGSVANFQYFTGSTMDAAPNSVFTLESIETTKPGAMGRMVMTMAKGTYHFMVEKDRIEQFEVRMNSAYTGIKGTEFIMESDGPSVTMKVLDGVVDFGSPGKTVQMEKGQVSTVVNNGAPTSPVPFDIASEPRWWPGGGAGCCGSALVLGAVLLPALLSRRR